MLVTTKRPMLPILALALALTSSGCGETTVTSISVTEWCPRIETALRERSIDCGCPEPPLTDAEIAARCAAMTAGSLEDAIMADEAGWNGVLAAALVARTASCDDALVADDPVIGDVPLGEPCRVFDDVATHPDDCELGATCAAGAAGGPPTCIALVGEGEACDGSACAPGLECGATGVCEEAAPELCF